MPKSFKYWTMFALRYLRHKNVKPGTASVFNRTRLDDASYCL